MLLFQLAMNASLSDWSAKPHDQRLDSSQLRNLSLEMKVVEIFPATNDMQSCGCFKKIYLTIAFIYCKLK